MQKKHLKEMTDSREDALVKTSILGVDVTNEKKEKILEYLVNSLQENHQKFYVVTPNPEIIVYASKHQEFKHILNAAQIALCDGTQVMRAARILGEQLQEKISGVDFMEELCQAISKKPITVGFLGGRNGVAELTAQCLTKKYPGLNVVYAGEELDEKYQASHSKDERNNKQNTKGIDILFVAFGFPKQEEWISRNLSNYNVKVMMGVGGAFDYVSGRVPRAPRLVQNIGFEWLYRLIIQPWRIKRQIHLIEFIWMVIQEKFRFKLQK